MQGSIPHHPSCCYSCLLLTSGGETLVFFCNTALSVLLLTEIAAACSAVACGCSMYRLLPATDVFEVKDNTSAWLLGEKLGMPDGFTNLLRNGSPLIPQQKSCAIQTTADLVRQREWECLLWDS